MPAVMEPGLGSKRSARGVPAVMEPFALPLVGVRAGSAARAPPWPFAYSVGDSLSAALYVYSFGVRHVC